MSKNDITNDEIKSRIYSTEARERHDDIFAKRTFNEWLDIEGMHDLPRKLGGKFITQQISYSEFRAELKSIGLL